MRREARLFEVVVVDDEDPTRQTLVAILEIAGWQVADARNPAEALSLLRDAPACRLLVTDINLGGEVDGFGVAEQARRLWPDMPVLYVSGEPERLADRALSRRDGTLPKPFRTVEFLDAIHALVPPPGPVPA